MLPCLPALALILLSGPADLNPTKPPSPAQQAYQQGQIDLQTDRFEDAIAHFRRSLRLDPTFVQNHLSLAAAFLARGEDREAKPHLNAYLLARPNHYLVRMPYSELLERLGELGEARRQLERFVAEAQGHPHVADNHLIGCHTRLMELAERLGDDYAERLNRGIGLYLLARKRTELEGEAARKVAEELLCKAAAELTLARLERPGEARPCWYLHGVWHELGQKFPARRWLQEAEQKAGANDLTPAERQELHLSASVDRAEDGRR